VAIFPYSETVIDFALYLGRRPGEARAYGYRRSSCWGHAAKIAGPANDRGDLNYVIAQIRPRLRPDVDLLDLLDAGTKRSLLFEARCLIFPSSRAEPPGLVMRETVACRTPIVALRDCRAAVALLDSIFGFFVGRQKGLANAVQYSAGLLPGTATSMSRPVLRPHRPSGMCRSIAMGSEQLKGSQV
jgi:hypothetical protein